MHLKLVSTATRRSVSRCSRGAAGVNTICHTYTGGVVDATGDVMKQPKVVPIYWGNTILGNTGFRLAFDQFFSELLNSDYVARLQQYNVQQPIVMPSIAIGGTATNVTKNQVAINLTTWFNNGTVPAPSPLSDASNWYYVILAPPGATIGQSGECGYHSSSIVEVTGHVGPLPVPELIDVAWGLVSFPTPASGADPVSVVNSVCFCLVHEMVEAFTNPRGNGWSVNVPPSGVNLGQNCEIGDLCETKTFHNVGRWSVETYWSNQDNACAGNFGPDWFSLGSPAPGVVGAPVAGHNQDGRLEVFVVGRDGSLWHRVQITPDGRWGAWQTVTTANPNVSASPIVGYNSDGRMEVYAIKSGGIPWHVWQTAPNGGWGSGALLGSPPASIIGNPTVANNLDGRMEVFGVSSDRQLHHIWQTAPNNGWSSWDSLGAPNPGISIGGPCVVSNADGRLEVFLLANDQQIWHIWQTAPNNGWSDWNSMGGPAAPISNGALFVGNNADGRIEVFTTGTDGAIYHMWQTAANGWSSWAQLLAQLPGIQFFGLGTVVNNFDGRFQLFFIASDFALWTIAQTSPSNGWGAVRFLDGAPPGQAVNNNQVPATALNADGNLATFIAGADGNIWQISQISPGGTWGNLITD